MIRRSATVAVDRRDGEMGSDNADCGWCFFNYGRCRRRKRGRE
jgi:hypothetical protein